MFDVDGIVKFRDPVSSGHFKILFGGDICPQAVEEKLIAGGKIGQVLAPLKDTIDAADYRIIQWETPLLKSASPIPKTGPNLISDPQCAEIAADMKFDLALLSNNHTGDHGPATVMPVAETLQRYGLTTVGAGRNLEESEKPVRTVIGGKNVTIFNWCEHEFGTATETLPGTAPLNSFRNVNAVRNAKVDSDFVIVTLHGGNEMNPFPSPRMIEMCRSLADAGADLVFNCHTHCVQGIEYWNGVPVIYCPGNLFFPDPDFQFVQWNTGYLATAVFDDRGVYALQVTPYHQTESQVFPMTGDAKRNFLAYLEKLSLPITDAHELNRYYEGWCCREGFNYLTRALKALPDNWAGNLSSEEVRKSILQLRNIFTCESHWHMVMTLLKIIEEGRFAEASAVLPEIDTLRNPQGF